MDIPNIPTLNPKLKAPIGIGILIFVSDFVLGWLSFILIVFPMIFVLALVVGFYTDSIEDSIMAYLIVLVIGNLVSGAIVAIVLYPGWLGSGIIDLYALAALFIITPFLAMTGTSTLLNGFAFNEFFLITFIIAPALYFFSFGFAAIGFKINKYLGNETDDTSDLQDSGFPKEIPDGTDDHEVVIESNSTN